MADERAEAAAATSPLGRWGKWLLLGAVAAMGLGTVLAILGVNVPGLFSPGVSVLLGSLILFAIAGVLRVLAPEP